MKKMYLILVLCCFVACKQEIKENRGEEKIDHLAELKLDIGLPKSYTDSLSLLSYMASSDNRVDYDKKYLKIDYKRKLDSLFELIDEELNIIGFEKHFTEDTRNSLLRLRQSFILDQKASSAMWSSSYGISYRAYRIDENAFKRIEQMIYKRRYEELLIYNYHLRVNLTRSWQDPNTFLFRKRLKDMMPQKVFDSMYPQKKKSDI